MSQTHRSAIIIVYSLFEEHDGAIAKGTVKSISKKIILHNKAWVTIYHNVRQLELLHTIIHIYYVFSGRDVTYRNSFERPCNLHFYYSNDWPSTRKEPGMLQMQLRRAMKQNVNRKICECPISKLLNMIPRGSSSHENS